MADTVNPQITDAVASPELSVSNSSASALANLYQAYAQALAIAAQNAVTAEQNMNTVLQAATAQAVAQLLAEQ